MFPFSSESTVTATLLKQPILLGMMKVREAILDSHEDNLGALIQQLMILHILIQANFNQRLHVDNAHYSLRESLGTR